MTNKAAITEAHVDAAKPGSLLVQDTKQDKLHLRVSSQGEGSSGCSTAAAKRGSSVWPGGLGRCRSRRRGRLRTS